MQETLILPPSQEDPLEEDMGTHSCILVWITQRPEEPGSPQSVGSQRVGHDWAAEHRERGGAENHPGRESVKLKGMTQVRIWKLWGRKKLKVINQAETG